MTPHIYSDRSTQHQKSKKQECLKLDEFVSEDKGKFDSIYAHGSQSK